MCFTNVLVLFFIRPWLFVVYGTCRLRTTLCLQYKQHYIAAGFLFLAAKLQKVKLPTTKGNVWWLQFDVSPKQLECMLCMCCVHLCVYFPFCLFDFPICVHGYSISILLIHKFKELVIYLLRNGASSLLWRNCEFKDVVHIWIFMNCWSNFCSSFQFLSSFLKQDSKSYKERKSWT